MQEEKFGEKVKRWARTVTILAQFSLSVYWLGKHKLPKIMNRSGVSLERRNEMLQVIHEHAKLLMKRLVMYKQLKIKVIGKASQTPCLVVANHPSLFDYLVLLLAFPKSVCTFQQEVLENKLFGPFVKVAGYIDDGDGTREGNIRLAERTFDRFRENQNVIAFPEGELSKAPLKPERFRPAFFQGAVEQGAYIQPVAIWCDPVFLGKGQSWTTLANTDNRMVVSILPPFQVSRLPEERRTAKGVSEVVQSMIAKELQRIEEVLMKQA